MKCGTLITIYFGPTPIEYGIFVDYSKDVERCLVILDGEIISIPLYQVGYP